MRDLRGFSQEYMASKLGIDQKQYSRMELKEEKLSLEELEGIAEVLEIPVPDLLGFDEKVFFNNCTQQHVLGKNNTYHETNDKERELYEHRIEHLSEEVAYLRTQLEVALKSSASALVDG